MDRFSREVHEFGTACEHLISFHSKSCLSHEEELYISFYLSELEKRVGHAEPADAAADQQA